MNNVTKILGAPGCGKTHRLMQVLTEVLKSCPPERVAFVSFTKKGTYEGVERAKMQFGFKDAQLPYFRTLHSIAFRAGEYSRHDMISRQDYREFSDAMGMRFTGYYTPEFYSDDDKYLFMHFMRLNNPVTADKYMDDISVRTLEDVELNYTRFKTHACVHDFTDIIERFVQADEALPVDYAIIDEAQDLTTLQWAMCDVAFAKCKRVYVAGDDDQAIYEWSGADVDRFLRLKADEVEVLHQSYRLKSSVLSVAKHVSSQISDRIDKQFKADERDGEGSVHYYNDLNDVKLGDGTWYFLSRNNWYLQQYREYLRVRARVFIDKDGLSFDQRQVDAINIFEAARKRGKLTDVDELKLKGHVKGQPDLTRPWYEVISFPNDVTVYYRDLVKNRTDLKDRSITVDTIHGVKGGEADNVVLMLNFTKAVKLNMDRNPDSELRCLYVAVTRAKKNLHIVYSSSANGYDEYVRRTE
jgi:superfamily I DNA/RNA helicase